MGARTISPGGALLRTSRMFSVPKPLAESQATNLHMADHKSATMTKPYPQSQSITSPLSSREKGDWGFKRPFPLKTTMGTSTPLVRVKSIDAVESVTDFASAADHTLSLEKFQELHLAMSVPRVKEKVFGSSSVSQQSMFPKSVFEEDLDVTDFDNGGRTDDRGWKFRGPWLARMTQGDFMQYLNKQVRPKRAQFRALLRNKLAEDITANQNAAAMDQGKPAPPAVLAKDVTDAQFTSYLRSLRNDRVTLYALVSNFLDLPPLGQPVGFVQTIWREDKSVPESPYGKAGPPPSHPSAGISYLRTGSYMENHPVYGPQAQKSPVLARVVYPRYGGNPVKLGVGGFVADAPAGHNEFNFRPYKQGQKPAINGVQHLDTTTYGGAKAYVDPATASVDPSGKVVLELKETTEEAKLLAQERAGGAKVYDNSAAKRDPAAEKKLRQIADEMLKSGSERQSRN
ncbi:hypothetical protein K4F52_001781 [Lecanicillium sp. MT-2017a]|nr:hypothetical protein K4F52_001781 [Lecanicillium sp. MT-2017a]